MNVKSVAYFLNCGYSCTVVSSADNIVDRRLSNPTHTAKFINRKEGYGYDF